MSFSLSGAFGGAGAGGSMSGGNPYAAGIGFVAGGLFGGGDDAAAEAAAQQVALQREMWMKEDPFGYSGQRAQYVPQLTQLMQGGLSGLQQDPMYRQLQTQGMDAVRRTMAASGKTGSGAEMSAILKQNMGLGMEYFNQQYTRLAQLSGASGGYTPHLSGMSPETAGRMQMMQNAEMGQGIGMLAYGASKLFGNPVSKPTVPGSSGQYSNSNTWGAPGEGDYPNPFGGTF